MNEQMMRPPQQQLPYHHLWAAPAPPHPPAMELAPAGFVGGKPARPTWKRKPQQQPAPAMAGGARRGGAAAPRNTTSFLIRAKRAGGVASLVSPCPVTPAVLPTPQLSPAHEVVVEMAKEFWGVNGYGSMKGLIRLRSHAAGGDVVAGGEDDSGSGLGESDVEEHVEVERRLDHDLSRFEMVQLPAVAAFGEDAGDDYEDEEARAARLEEENLTLRHRLFLMERDMADLRRRLVAVEDLCLCRDRHRDGCVVDATAAAADDDNAAPSETSADLTGDEAGTADAMMN